MSNDQTEWQDLPDLQAVAKAQADGWEIECSYLAWDWMPWHGYTWHHTFSYRGRTRQPTMKEVKMECWFCGRFLHWASTKEPVPSRWIRQPHLDLIARVPE